MRSGEGRGSSKQREREWEALEGDGGVGKGKQHSFGPGVNRRRSGGISSLATKSGLGALALSPADLLQEKKSTREREKNLFETVSKIPLRMLLLLRSRPRGRRVFCSVDEDKTAGEELHSWTWMS